MSVHPMDAEVKLFLGREYQEPEMSHEPGGILSSRRVPLSWQVEGMRVVSNWTRDLK